MSVKNEFVISPRELREAHIPEQFRGYSHAEVNDLFERAARTLEHLSLLVQSWVSEPPPGQVSARELVDTDITVVTRGYHKDTVNELAERAALTIELLETKTGQESASPAPRLNPIAAEIVPDDDEDVQSEIELMPYAQIASHPTAPLRVSLGDRSYDIKVGAHSLQDLGVLVSDRRKVAVVTQPEILRHHGERLNATIESTGVTHEWFLIGDGEQAKALSTVEDLCDRFAATGLLRGDCVIAFGGGIVGDVAGYAAASYHRGVDWVGVPTTLLAMVDSSIGGKTGVNLPHGKNLVGAFHQPRGVFIDPDMLMTLTPAEFRCGLGEVVKYALLGDAELLRILSEETDAVLRRDATVMKAVIDRSAAMKAHFVSADEFERTGLRTHLNYGHTLAHAIETVSDHALLHGEAVAVGLVFAGELARALGRIDRSESVAHRTLVERLGLVSRAPQDLSRESLIEAMRRDKKASGGLSFVLSGPRGIERVDDPDVSALNAAFSAVGIE